MRRVVVHFPGLVAVDGDSVLRNPPPELKAIADRGRIDRLAPTPQLETPEALLLGMSPREGQMRQGPLTIAALGADPPPRSTHFHVSVGSLKDDVVSVPKSAPTADDVAAVVAAANRLNTRDLTFVAGIGLDHGLVWERVGDLGTTALHQNLSFTADRPEGDGEPLLRRWIDDSVNILADHPINLQRIDEGAEPLNILWPWGHGVRQAVPNLFLQRGEQTHVESGSLRLAGLSRLAGYRHGGVQAFGHGTGVAFGAIARTVTQNDASIVVFDVTEFRQEGRIEELDWFLREFDREFLGALTGAPVRITLLTDGLALRYDQEAHCEPNAPFDERALEEAKLNPIDIATLVELGLRLEA